MKELFRIYLDKFSNASKTIHSNEYGELPMPFALSIVQYDDDNGFYLFYLDEFGNEQTDTYHDNLEKAFDQAEFEFGIKKNDWVSIEGKHNSNE